MNFKRIGILGLISLLALGGAALRAEVPPDVVQAASVPSPNAALIYWSAFGVMPSLSQPQREALRTAISSSDAIPEQVLADLALCNTSLRELHRAVRVPTCDWGLDHTAGPFMLLPHCQHARDLAAAGVLRARVAFSRGDTASAINDLLAVLRLARDCGRDPLTISILVDVAIERGVIDVLAANLFRLSPAQQDDLLQRLQALPATQSAAAAFRYESQSFSGWVARRIESETAQDTSPTAGGRILKKILQEALLGDSLKGSTEQETQRRQELISSAAVEDLQTMVQVMKTDFESVARIADQPYPDRAAQFAKFELELAGARELANRDDLRRLLSVEFLPNYALISQRFEESYVRRQLLELAIRQQRHGADAIRGARIHGVDIESRSTDTGIELRYQLPGADTSLVLKISTK